MKKVLLALALCTGLVTPAISATTTYAFNCLTNSNAANCNAGHAQLFMDVSSTLQANQVLFEFRNVGPDASSIADIYFDDGTLLGIAQVFNMPGVSFSVGASPGNLPGGNTASPTFVTTAGFSADSDAPVSPNGVNPGEKVGILFNLISGQSYTNALNALQLGGGPNGLRVGIHVQSFANGGSESFINHPISISPVPEAKQWLMLLVGLSFVAARAMRR